MAGLLANFIQGVKNNPLISEFNKGAQQAKEVGPDQPSTGILNTLGRTVGGWEQQVQTDPALRQGLLNMGATMMQNTSPNVSDSLGQGIQGFINGRTAAQTMQLDEGKLGVAQNELFQKQQAATEKTQQQANFIKSVQDSIPNAPAPVQTQMRSLLSSGSPEGAKAAAQLASQYTLGDQTQTGQNQRNQADINAAYQRTKMQVDATQSDKQLPQYMVKQPDGSMQLQTLQQDKKGNLIDAQGQSVDRTTLGPEVNPVSQNENADAGAFTRNKASEAVKLNSRASAVGDMLSQVAKVQDAVTVNPNVIGTPSGFATTVNNIGAAVKGVVDVIKSGNSSSENAKVDAWIEQELSGKKSSRFQGFFKGVNALSIEAAPIRSTLKDIMWAQAKSNNSSGAITKRDVEQAAEQLSVDSSDPQVLLSTLHSAVNSSAESVLRAYDYQSIKGTDAERLLRRDLDTFNKRQPSGPTAKKDTKKMSVDEVQNEIDSLLKGVK